VEEVTGVALRTDSQGAFGDLLATLLAEDSTGGGELDEHVIDHIVY